LIPRFAAFTLLKGLFMSFFTGTGISRPGDAFVKHGASTLTAAGPVSFFQDILNRINDSTEEINI
jgi:hypothetical protein